MTTASEPLESLHDISSEEARQSLIRFLGRQNLDEHEEIYDELATE